MGEVHHADDAEDHRVADGNEAIDRTERDAVDELLDEDFHARAPPRGIPGDPAIAEALGGARRASNGGTAVSAGPVGRKSPSRRGGAAPQSPAASGPGHGQLPAR